jgi:Holliday junction DNA helicase RuvA
MIAFIRGVVENVAFDSVVIDVSGVGYGIRLHVRDVSSLKKGQNAQIFISEIIREQSYDLYGFIQIEDKNFFDLLLKHPQPTIDLSP